MNRFRTIEPANAIGKTRALLDGLQRELGMVPNLARSMANSPTTLRAYLGMEHALAAGALAPTLRRQIALAVSQANGCRYGLAAHTALAKSIGLSDEAIRDARRGGSPDRKTDIALRFAVDLVESRGHVSPDTTRRLLKSGHSQADVAEMVANVALTILANYFGHVANPTIDFPVAPEVETAARPSSVPTESKIPRDT